MDDLSQRRADNAVKDMSKAMLEAEKSCARMMDTISAETDAIEIMNRELEALGVPRDADQFIADACVLLGFVTGRLMARAKQPSPAIVAKLVSDLAAVVPDSGAYAFELHFTCDSIPGIHAHDAARYARILSAGMAEVYFGLDDYWRAKDAPKDADPDRDSLWAVAVAASAFITHFYCLIVPKVS